MPKRTSSTEQIAELHDVERGTVLNWAKKGCPHDRPTRKNPNAGNRYNAGEVQTWLNARGLSGKVGRPTDDAGDELKALKIQKEKLLIARYQREADVEMRKLIDAAEEQKRDVQKIAVARNRLRGLGANLSPRLEGLDGAERQSLIDATVEEILISLAGE